MNTLTIVEETPIWCGPRSGEQPTGAPRLVMNAKTKRQFLQKECKTLPEDLREEAWLIRKLCYGALLDEVAKDRAFPAWFFKCNDNFLGLLTSEEARFLKSSGFRYCDYGPGATTSRSVERRDGGTCHHIPISHQMDMLGLQSVLNRACHPGHSENLLVLM